MEFTNFSSPFDEAKQSAQQFCEVQAIILAHYSTFDVHPLLQADSASGREKAKFLLPFGNEPIITYPLRLLEIHGFTEILVVIAKEFEEDMTNFLNQYKPFEGIHDDKQFSEHIVPNINPVTVSEEDLGELQVLKQIRAHIKTDFLVMRCDCFTNAPLRELLHIHRRENASITLLLSKPTLPKQSDPKKKKKKKDAQNTHIIGTDRKYHKQLIQKGHPKEVERLWYMKSRLDLEDEEHSSQLQLMMADKHDKHDEPQLMLNKSLLDCIPNLRFTTRLEVNQIGIFCQWVLLWIVEDAPKEYELLYHEAVPHLIDMQADINYACGGGGATTVHASSSSSSSMESTDALPPTQTQMAMSSSSSTSSHDISGLMRRSCSTADVNNETRSDGVSNIRLSTVTKRPALKRSNSHYTSGLMLSHGNDILGNDYMKMEDASDSSLPRSLMQRNMNSYRSDTNLKAFDDAKSDITAMSMSAMSMVVNAPSSPRPTGDTDVGAARTSKTLNASPQQKSSKSSPRTKRRVNSLPSPQHLASTTSDGVETVDGVRVARNLDSIDMDAGTKTSTSLREPYEDKLKVFGYTFEEDMEHGQFACIINNCDQYLNVSMNLIQALIDFADKQQYKENWKRNGQQQQQQSKKSGGGGNKNNPKRKPKMKMMDLRRIHNEERMEYLDLLQFENEGLLHLITQRNDMAQCRDMHPQAKIKDGCIIAANCTIGDNTRIDKCTVQEFVNIGKNCKITECVIFAHVTIGDNCVLHRCIVAANCTIADKCTIKSCKIADRANISKGSTFKNEILQSAVVNDFKDRKVDNDTDADADVEDDDDDDDDVPIRATAAIQTETAANDSDIVNVD